MKHLKICKIYLKNLGSNQIPLSRKKVLNQRKMERLGILFLEKEVCKNLE